MGASKKRTHDEFIKLTIAAALSVGLTALLANPTYGKQAAPAGYFKLQTAFLESKNKCLEGNQVAKGATLGGAAFMDRCQNVSGQMWKMVPVGPGYFRLQTAFLESKNKCLQGSEDEVFGAAAFMATCSDSWGQMWKMVPVGPGYFKLQNKFFENMCLEGNQVAKGATLGGAAFMDSCQNVSGQMWKTLKA